jgi:beta-aspartyl-peptidase (threonine type)
MSGGVIRPVVIVHGGAGDVRPETRDVMVATAIAAAQAGVARMEAGGSALDAAEAAVVVLEDDPHFNAGTGACLTETGSIELDASIMEGTTLQAGAVAALPPFRNPIRIARSVLEDGRHLLYAAEGAAAFAKAKGFAPSTVEALRTEAAVARLELVKKGRAGQGWAGGTVGAVACDSLGRVAAATSTGGTVGKAPGRVGDTPIIGAGTYADDRGGACSATGIGEAIIRICLSRLACDLMASGLTAPVAAGQAIAEFGERVGGSGGIVIVDRHGNVGWAKNTPTMTWAVARSGEEPKGGI